MVNVETRYEHIQLDQNNEPLIEGANMKVVELVLSQNAYGWSPEELNFQYPHLSMGQIYSALAYYWDHREEIESHIESRLQRVNHIQSLMPKSALKLRFQNKGLL